MMNAKSRLAESILTFLIAFPVTALVTVGWNAAFEHRVAADWGSATMLAVILAIVLPIAHGLRERHATQS